MLTQIAPTILARAVAAMIGDMDRTHDTDNARRPELEACALEAFTVLWHGVEIDEHGEYMHITIDAMRQSVNGQCSCGTICAARAAKRLIQLARTENEKAKPTTWGTPCPRCRQRLLEKDGYHDDYGAYTYGHCLNDRCRSPYVRYQIVGGQCYALD